MDKVTKVVDGYKMDFVSTEEELRQRLIADLNLDTNNPIVDAILYCVVIDCNEGFAEMEPIREKNNDLYCPWCGKLHKSEYHNELSRKFKEGQLEEMEV